MSKFKNVLKVLCRIIGAMVIVPVLFVILICYENYENPTDDRDRGHWPGGAR